MNSLGKLFNCLTIYTARCFLFMCGWTPSTVVGIHQFPLESFFSFSQCSHS